MEISGGISSEFQAYANERMCELLCTPTQLQLIPNLVSSIFPPASSPTAVSEISPRHFIVEVHRTISTFCVLDSNETHGDFSFGFCFPPAPSCDSEQCVWELRKKHGACPKLVVSLAATQQQTTAPVLCPVDNYSNLYPHSPIIILVSKTGCCVYLP